MGVGRRKLAPLWALALALACAQHTGHAQGGSSESSYGSYLDLPAIPQGPSGDSLRGVTVVPPLRAIPVVRAPDPVHNGRVCSTWGDFHYKTFDGAVFRFPGLCNYVFSAHCGGAYEDFNVQLRRSRQDGAVAPSRVIMKLEGLVVELTSHSVLVSGRPVQLPFSQAGVLIERSSGSLKVVAKLGLVFMWNQDDSLLLELDSKFANQTCGLCGDFNGIPASSEFLSHNTRLTPVEFGNLQKLDGPMEQCQDPAPENKRNCSTAPGVCEEVLGGELFSSCAELVDVNSYVEACRQDLCLCDSAHHASCICQTLAEYARQCAHAGGLPLDWRGPDLCPLTCPHDMEYHECRSPCADTCSNPERSQLCEDHCVAGCFCPEGTVLDDIGQAGCVPVTQCACTYNGATYASGAKYSTDCTECTCSGGRWSCQDIPCPGTCSVLGGAHFSTFDERQYTVHGDCSYVLAKSCNSSTFTVLAELRRCGLTDSETCLKSVTLNLDGGQTVVVFKASGEVFVNHIYTQLPVSAANVTIFRPSTFFIIAHSNLGLQLDIQLVPTMQVAVRLEPEFRGRTCGLCGNFNRVQADDFRAISGVVEGTAAAFFNTFKTHASCPNVKNNFEDPCSLSVENEKFAQHWCSRLTDAQGPFAQCHSAVSPGTYHSNCLFDTCNCEKSEDCLCAALASYVRACAAKGVLLRGWRDGVCTKHTSSCPKSMTYHYHISTCQPTCRARSEPDLTCGVSFVPVDGCACPEGTFLDDVGKCVEATSCPCYHGGSVVPNGESVHDSGTVCTCTQGTLTCIGGPAPAPVCDAPMVFFDCRNATAGATGAGCQKSCHTLDMECYSSQCVPGCVCPDGLVADGLGGCIAEEECPCVHNEASYGPGETIWTGCNTCTCENRKWRCSDEPCLATCAVYGDGHYLTFDGRRYSFSGDCEYTLLQDQCGGNVSAQDAFRVVTENVPCGTTGTTCSKAIKIFLGSYELKLSDGKVEVVEKGKGQEPPYSIRQMGIFLVLDTDAGLVLLWDRRTSLFLRLSPEFKGRVCGLCGNFDDNAMNDFTTRSQSVVGDALEFGNSWKFSPSCPDAPAPRDSCAANPYRKSWAQKQCSIVHSATFAACHAHVEPAEYYEACVQDACACDSGGDCECFCTAVAAYAQACHEVGVCVSWRSPDVCPLFCDFYNPEGQCEWHYQPCGAPCMRTCRNPSGECLHNVPGLEGCYPKCPSTAPIFDEDEMKCVATCPLPPPAPRCHVHGKSYRPGATVPSDENCHSCVCTESGVRCAYDAEACICTYHGRHYKPGTVIYHTTDGTGGCISARCGANGTIDRTVSPCSPTTAVPPTTFSFSTTPSVVSSTRAPSSSPSPAQSTAPAGRPSTTVSAATSRSPRTVPSTAPTPAPTDCGEQCLWSPWLDVSRPGRGSDSGDYDTLDNLRAHGYRVCQQPREVECRAEDAPAVALSLLGQRVQCTPAVGLTCHNREQASGQCHNYQIRILCCSPLACHTSSLTVHPTTSSTTHTGLSPTPVTATGRVTASEATTTPAPGTPSLSQTTAVTPSPTTGPTTAGTTPSRSSPTLETSATPSEPAPHEPSRVSCMQEICNWTQWIDGSYPGPGRDSGDFDTFQNLRAKGYKFCKTPSNVQCRAQFFPNTPLAELGQDVTCNREEGLICLNKNQLPPICYNYEIRIQCCQVVDSCRGGTTVPPTSETTQPTRPETSSSAQTAMTRAVPSPTTRHTAPTANTQAIGSRTTTRHHTGTTPGTTTTTLATTTHPTSTSRTSTSSTETRSPISGTPKGTTSTSTTSSTSTSRTRTTSKGTGSSTSLTHTGTTPAPTTTTSATTTHPTSTSRTSTSSTETRSPISGTPKGTTSTSTTSSTSTSRTRTTSKGTGSSTSMTHTGTTPAPTTTTSATTTHPTSTSRTSTSSTETGRSTSTTHPRTRTSSSPTTSSTPVPITGTTSVPTTSTSHPGTQEMTHSQPTTPDCQPRCSWTKWFDVDFPAPGVHGGDKETYDNILRSGERICRRPEEITRLQCRAENHPDVTIEQLGQVVQCDPDVGLVCQNRDQDGAGRMCLNYEVRVLCCETPSGCPTHSPPTVPSTPRETVTSPTHTTSSMGTGSSTSSTRPSPTSAPTTSSTSKSGTSTPSTETGSSTSVTRTGTTSSPTTTTSAPTTTTSAPTTTTSAPTTTASSTTTTSAHSTTTSAHITTTSSPTTTTSAPTTTTSAPTTTTSAHTTTTSAPTTTTFAPTTTTSAPTTTTSAHSTTTSAHITTTSAPTTATSAPTTTASAHSTTTSAHTTSTSAPTTTTSVPSSSSSSTSRTRKTSKGTGSSTSLTHTGTTPAPTTTTSATTTHPTSTSRTSTSSTETRSPISGTPKGTTSTSTTSSTSTSRTRTTSKGTGSSTSMTHTGTTPAPTTTTSATTTHPTSTPRTSTSSTETGRSTSTTHPRTRTSSSPTTSSTPVPITGTTSVPTTSTSHPGTQEMTHSQPTTPDCQPRCSWTKWFDVDFPAPGVHGGDKETYDNILRSGERICRRPEEITRLQCRAENHPDVTIEQLGQVVQCDPDVGLVCQNRDQDGAGRMCLNYEVRVLCCETPSGCPTHSPPTVPSTPRETVTSPTHTTSSMGTGSSTSSTRPSPTSAPTTSSTSKSGTSTPSTETGSSTSVTRTGTTSSPTTTTSAPTTTTSAPTTTVSSATTTSAHSTTTFAHSSTTSAHTTTTSAPATTASSTTTTSAPTTATSVPSSSFTSTSRTKTTSKETGSSTSLTHTGTTPAPTTTTSATTTHPTSTSRTSTSSTETRSPISGTPKGTTSTSTTSSTSTSRTRTTSKGTGSSTSMTHTGTTPAPTTTTSATTTHPTSTSRTSTSSTETGRSTSTTHPRTRTSSSPTTSSTPVPITGTTSVPITSTSHPGTQEMTHSQPTTPDCQPRCSWTKWFDVDFPAPGVHGGDKETYDNILRSGERICRRPEEITRLQCRAENHPDVTIEQLGQVVQCDPDVGLVCQNRDQDGAGRMCLNYEVRVLCCETPSGCPTYSPPTVPSTPRETVTSPTHTTSSMGTGSSTSSTRPSPTSAPTTSSTSTSRTSTSSTETGSSTSVRRTGTTSSPTTTTSAPTTTVSSATTTSAHSTTTFAHSSTTSAHTTTTSAPATTASSTTTTSAPTTATSAPTTTTSAPTTTTSVPSSSSTSTSRTRTTSKETGSSTSLTHTGTTPAPTTTTSATTTHPTSTSRTSTSSTETRSPISGTPKGTTSTSTTSSTSTSRTRTTSKGTGSSTSMTHTGTTPAPTTTTSATTTHPTSTPRTSTSSTETGRSTSTTHPRTRTSSSPTTSSTPVPITGTTSVPITSTSHPGTQEMTHSQPTTPDCQPRCSWTKWFDVDFPAPGVHGGDKETYDNILRSGERICRRPEEITRLQCRAENHPDVTIEQLGQVVQCDPDVGLVCQNRDQDGAGRMCLNYEVRVLCCETPSGCPTHSPPTVPSTPRETVTRPTHTTSSMGTGSSTSSTRPSPTSAPTTSSTSTSRTSTSSTETGSSTSVRRTGTTSSPTTTTSAPTTTTSAPTTTTSAPATTTSAPATTVSSTTTTSAHSTTTSAHITTTSSPTTTTSAPTTTTSAPTTTTSAPTTATSAPTTTASASTTATSVPSSSSTSTSRTRTTSKGTGSSTSLTHTGTTPAPTTTTSATTTHPTSTSRTSTSSTETRSPISGTPKGTTSTSTTSSTSTSRTRTTSKGTGSSTSLTHTGTTPAPTTTTSATTTHPTSTPRTSTSSTETGRSTSTTHPRTRTSSSPTTSSTPVPITGTTSVPITSTSHPGTQEMTHSQPTTPDCQPRCSWTKWFDVDFPAPGVHGGDKETYDNILRSGERICRRPEEITRLQCRAENHPDVTIEQLGQVVQCDPDVGLVCQNRDQDGAGRMCLNYEVRVLCCETPSGCPTHSPPTVPSTPWETVTRPTHTTSSMGTGTSTSSTRPSPTSAPTTSSTSTSRTSTSSTETGSSTSVTRTGTTSSPTTTTSAPTTTTSAPTTTTSAPTTATSAPTTATSAPATTVSSTTTTSAHSTTTSAHITTTSSPTTTTSAPTTTTSAPTTTTSAPTTATSVPSSSSTSTSRTRTTSKETGSSTSLTHTGKTPAPTTTTSATTTHPTSTSRTSTSSTETRSPISGTPKGTTSTSTTSSTSTSRTRTTSKGTGSSTSLTHTGTTPAPTTTTSATTTHPTSTPRTSTSSTETGRSTSTTHPRTRTSSSPTTSSTPVPITGTTSVPTTSTSHPGTQEMTHSQPTTPDCQPRCSWTKWFDVDFPAPGVHGGDKETYDNILRSGERICRRPEEITRLQCRAENHPDVTIEQLGQVVQCDPDVGLVCQNRDQDGAGRMCLNYEVRVLCCETPSSCPTTPPLVTSSPMTPSTAPSTLAPSTALVHGSSQTTTPCFCFVAEKLYPAGAVIYHQRDLEGHCYHATCNPDCQVVRRVDSDCPPTTPPAIQTTPPSTSTSQPVTPSGCSNTIPPRKKGETWPMPNCSQATCEGHDTISVHPRQCPEVSEPTCANGYPPQKEVDQDGCCYHYQCQCVCSGWGDPHYITFDGTYYTFLDNCTYVLMQQIVPVFGHLRVLIDNYFCDAEDGLSCPQSIIVEYGHDRVVMTRRPVAGVMTNQVIFNGKVVGPGFEKDGIVISRLGIKMYVTIPKLGVQVMFTGLIFSVEVPFNKFANNTEGQCGTCTNDKKDECRLPGGKVAASCSAMSHHWKVTNPDQPSCSGSPGSPADPTTMSPTEPATTCPPSTICELILSEVFEPCHSTIPPLPFYEGCAFDHCHVSSPDVVCSGLELYASLCAAFDVCIDWRGLTNGTCSFTCPPDKVYLPCGPSNPPYCYGNDSANLLTLPEAGPITEGCFCPESTLLFSTSVEVCVPTGCPRCMGPSGEPVMPGDTISFACQECTCEGSSMTMACRAKTCPPAPACELSGFVSVPLATAAGECCPQYTCACNASYCPKPVDCPAGAHMTLLQEGGACCPIQKCRWTQCNVNGTLYEPGAVVSSTLCETCRCELPDSPEVFKVTCETQICPTHCPVGYAYQAQDGQCCGQCVQVACVSNSSSGSAHLYSPGESWPDPEERCVTHKCERHLDGLVVVTTRKACPPLSCPRDQAQLSEDGCCLFCPPPPSQNMSTCAVHHRLQVIREQGCSSTEPVRLAYCRGNCGDTGSMYSLAANTVEHRCSCCQELRTSQRKLSLRCADGSRRDFNYTQVEECGCQGQRCPAPADAGHPGPSESPQWSPRPVH
ncbi:mucin-5AC isoform X2 [Oryctolagus cuniculus]|uniref:mucin-5AC isoform X2 n=1 Tax=Oryctolagus cuniculus TaxID=9986 RepID=UPI003879F65E